MKKHFLNLISTVLLLSVFLPVSAQNQLVWEETEHRYLLAITDFTFRFDTAKLVVENPAKELKEPIDTWNSWLLVKNYTYGKNRGDMPMIADLKALHPYFRDQIITLIQRCEEKGIKLEVVESYRTKAKQSEYYRMGKKYTRTTGGKSKHQYGLAVDLVPVVDGKAIWEDKVLWKKIGVIGESLGLRWGGRWRSPYDPAHFEWTGGLTTEQLQKGYLPSFYSLHHYPCLEEDLISLQESWEAWETEQAEVARK